MKDDEFDFSDLKSTVADFVEGLADVRHYEEMKPIFAGMGLEISSDRVLTKYNGRGGRVEIPKEIVAIADNAFKDSPLLTEVVVHGDLKSVGNNAFNGCRVLQSCEFKGSVEKLGRSVFGGCEMLERVVLPQGVKEIPDSTFYNCNRLVKVVNSRCVERVGSYAFCNCVKLPSAEFENLKIIDGGAFRGCIGLTSFDPGSRLEYLGEACFKNCDSLSDIKLPDSVKTMGKSCFECTGIREMTIPRDTVKIETGAFAGCFDLRSVKFHDGVLEIGATAFAGCVNLSDIYVGENVVWIHAAAFNDCKSLSVSPNNKKYKYAANCIVDVVGGNATVISSLQGAVIVNGVDEIGKYSFSNRKVKADRLVVPPSVKRIGAEAFANSAIKEIIIYSERLSIENDAFECASPNLCIQCKPNIKSELANNRKRYGLPDGCTLKEIKG